MSPKYGAYMLWFQLASNYINIFIPVFYCVRSFNTASFASKKFGPESSLSSSPQISHQVYAPGDYPYCSACILSSPNKRILYCIVLYLASRT